MRILGLSRWWRVSSATNTTRFGTRFASKSTTPPQLLVDAVPQKAESTEASSSASLEPRQTRGELSQDSQVKNLKKKRIPLTTEEAQKFVDMYNKGMSNRDILSNMPGRNYQYINALGWRYRRGNLDVLLRVEKQTRLPWTDEEKKTLLRLLDANASRKVLCSSFPGRSASAVQIMVCKPRGDPSWGKPCKPRRWTLTEDTLLRESAAQGHSPQDLMQPLNRSIKSISYGARLLGLTLRRDMFSPKKEEDLVRWDASYEWRIDLECVHLSFVVPRRRIIWLAWQHDTRATLSE